MAFETLGIGGVLTFSDTQARKAMARTSAAFSRVQMRAQRLSVGMQKVGAGIRSLGMVSIGAAIGLGIGAKSAIDFEHQMGAVAAVTRSTSAELQRNTSYARKLGIETAFSATQAAEAMEILGKFGLAKKPLRAATKGVTDLAAAEGIQLAAAGRVAIGSLRAMNMSVMESERSANVLALTSASTAANAIGLGESFAYAGGTAQAMNLSYEQSSAVFGLMANRMMMGSRAGTGLMALFRGLQGTTGPSVKAMKSLGVDVGKFGGDLKRLPEIITAIDTALKKKFTTPLKRAKIITKIFGRFGQVAFFALAGAGGKALSNLTKKLEQSGRAFKDKFGRPIGAAAWMAQQRLNTVKGQIILFKSSLESFFITIFQGLLGPMKNRINDITQRFNSVLFAMQALEGDDSIKNQTKLVAKYGRTTMQVALGVRDALKMVGDMWQTLGSALKRVSKLFGQTMGSNTLRTVIKFALGFTMVLASISPLFIALLGMKMLFGAIASIASGAFIMIQAVALPVLVAVGAIAGALLILRNQGESLGQTAMRILTGIASYVMDLYDNAIKPLFMGIWTTMKSMSIGMSGFWNEVAGKVKGYIMDMVGSFQGGSGRMISAIKPVLSTIKAVILKLRPFFKAYIRFQLTVLGTMIKIGKAVMGFHALLAGILKSMFAVLKPVIMELTGIFGGIFAWLFKIASTAVKAIGAAGLLLIGIWRKVYETMKPLFAAFAKMLTILYRVGRIVIDVILIPFRNVYAVLKIVGAYLWKKLGPAFSDVATTVGTIFSTIVSAGKAIVSHLTGPFKTFIGWIAKALKLLEAAANVIPGMSTKNITKLRRTMEGWAGVGMIVGRRMGPTRMRRAERVEMVQTTKAQAAAQAKETEHLIKWRAKREALEVKIEDKREINLKTTTSIDGRCVASASARHRVEIQERAGFGMTPWQRRAVILRATETVPVTAR